MSAASKKRTRKPRAAAQHPKYADMIVAAISGMKERGGTSRQKIIKYIGCNYKVGNGFEVQVRLAIKRMLQAKKLIQVKGTGASGSFRLSAKATKKPVKARRRRSLKKRSTRKPRRATKRRSSGSKKRKARKTTAGKKRRSASKRPAKKPRTQSKRKAPRKKTSRGRK